MMAGPGHVKITIEFGHALLVFIILQIFSPSDFVFTDALHQILSTLLFG